MKNKILILLTLLLTNSLIAQKGKADKEFESKGYGVYLEMQSKEDLAKLDRPTIIRMAKSSRKTGDSRTAEQLYAVLIEQEDNEPLFHLYYAQALQTNGDYLNARNHFRICDERLKAKAKGRSYDQRAKLGWEACNKIAELRSIGPVAIQNEGVLNSDKLEFSPMYYNKGLLFVSTRTKGEARDRWINDNYMDLYYAPREEDGSLGKPELFADELNTELHEGPCVFTKDQKRIFFTRNDLYKGKRGKSKDGTTKLNLYTAELISGEWANEKELPFNHTDIDQAHPALTKSETILVFASNEKGGYGGMDLWASYLKDGEWSKPINLGARINTAGDEVFPYIHQDGTLFFSSNGWSSLGGLDVFMATQVYNHPDSLWEFPFNVGSPINSQNDDFGFIINKDKTEGYFSSVREEGSGGDDIYSFKIKDGLDDVAPLPTMNIDICVYDDDSRLRLESAKVIIKKDTEKEDKAVENITNEYGYTVCKLRAGDPYFIEVVKEGYIDVSDYFIMPKEVEGLDEYCIGLVRDPSIVLEEEVVVEEPPVRKIYSTTDIPPVNYTYDPNTPLPPTHVVGRVLNMEYDRPLPNTSVILLNRCTGEELVMEVADNGEFAFPLECGCEYVVKSKKNKFFSDNQVISLLNEEDCNKPIQLEMSMKPNFDRVGNPFLLSNEGDKSIKEGDVIELKSIFYDYDKWNIRPDAASDLENLARIMEKYPSMEIELSSHTDTRGADLYNQELSEKRAKSARAYLIQKGIQANRIEAVGYGEGRLRNKCKICSESDHQENRRTEVLITKFQKIE
ncbi:OmpA family protein [Aureispira anguillae]|uniref:OmpA family protein n=1 Tax=Aureispira anguillae TaxID=2864201 RepID=A0A915YHL9_9BACT|nr:OmpA family protein [Aureispira anguillae]BDS13333.1 OmpA family protein [Aureispira anguillae]